jgi:hypothetical protein
MDGSLLVSFFFQNSTERLASPGLASESVRSIHPLKCQHQHQHMTGIYFRKMERGMYVYDRPFLLAMENPLDTTADVGRYVTSRSRHVEAMPCHACCTGQTADGGKGEAERPCGCLLSSSTTTNIHAHMHAHMHAHRNSYNMPAIRVAFAQAYARLHNVILHPPPGTHALHSRRHACMCWKGDEETAYPEPSHTRTHTHTYIHTHIGPPVSLLSAAIRPDDVLSARPMPKRSIFMTRVFTPREPYPQLAAIVSGAGGWKACLCDYHACFLKNIYMRALDLSCG